jgi:hypothetical protein
MQVLEKGMRGKGKRRREGSALRHRAGRRSTSSSLEPCRPPAMALHPLLVARETEEKRMGARVLGRLPDAGVCCSEMKGESSIVTHG